MKYMLFYPGKTRQMEMKGEDSLVTGSLDLSSEQKWLNSPIACQKAHRPVKC